MIEHVSKGLRSKSFATGVTNGLNKLPEDVVEVGSVCELGRMLDNAWLSVFGEDSV